MSSVIGGRSAQFEQVDATPRPSANPKRHPADETGRQTAPVELAEGLDGTSASTWCIPEPEPITDVDGSSEGWIRAYPLLPGRPVITTVRRERADQCAELFPSNNYPSDSDVPTP